MMANRSTGFVQIAQSAASYEQQGEFELAAGHWDQSRMQFCDKAAVRVWLRKIKAA